MPTVYNRPTEQAGFNHGEIPTNVSAPWGVKSYWERRGFRHLPGEDRTRPLAYSTIRARGKFVAGSPYLPWYYGYPPTPNTGEAEYTGNSGWTSGNPPWLAIRKNRAYDKFKQSAIGETSSIGVLAAERKEAFGMIANRVIGLHNAYRHLRKGRFKDFLRALSVDPKRKHRSWARTSASEASGLWLEYWFGWSPTIKDLYSIGSTLSNHEPEGWYTGSSAGTLPPITKRTRNGNNFRDVTEQGFCAVKMGAKVRLTNPNLQLMANLGLVNPVSIAWELVPFSFVVDWFTGFGNVIEGFSDFVGCEITDPYWTQYVKVKQTWRTGSLDPRYFTGDYEYTKVRMSRRLEFLRPVPSRPSFVNVGRSKTRAATAVSLLTQLFLSK